MSDSLEIVYGVPRLPPRETEGHKGDYGRVLIIGGSAGMIGAPALAGLAALRGGAGLVTLAIPASIQPHTATLCPCATSIPLPETHDRLIDPEAARGLFESMGFLSGGRGGPDVVAVGPGVGRGDLAYGDAFWHMIDGFRREAGIPVVVDADALNMLHREAKPDHGRWEHVSHPRTIITPHPGEMARLHGAGPGDVQKDREGFATRTAATLNAQNEATDAGAVVVLKGATTLVCDDRRLYRNTSGNPGMATGGSGDVLTGLIAALLGQGMGLFDASVAGVYVHGLAGDIGAEDIGQPSLMAKDLIDYLPDAFDEWLALSEDL